MDEWPNKLKILMILATVKELLENSCYQKGINDENPKLMHEEISRTIEEMKEQDNLNILIICDTWFASTGPLQELSLANGWPLLFESLAEELDKIKHNEVTTQQGASTDVDKSRR